ncbi:unnamed protein product, partial [Prunus brigantina]
MFMSPFSLLKCHQNPMMSILMTVGVSQPEKLPQNRPLWEIHILKYPTSHAAGTLIFKLHHALGAGYSLMGALLSCLQNAQ